ncbi:hypothetical protein HK103_005299 [Boothiomyces macroporosus]|uniref:Cyclic nucleotide-binding domain-containing protein n=1 Tax=Boothiomyces macroporosus TaxID=261099 RepID=A0AAD5UFE8_9FUNG|nr:hypothetical protein HK103_005299 [Boothiomyces macroporosus]
MSKPKDVLPNLPSFNTKLKNVDSQSLIERVATTKQKVKVNTPDMGSPPSRHNTKKLNPVSPVEKEERKDPQDGKRAVVKSDQDTQLPRQKTAKTPGVTTLSEFMLQRKQSEGRKSPEIPGGISNGDITKEQKQENQLSKKTTFREKSLTEQKLNQKGIAAKDSEKIKSKTGSEAQVFIRERSKSDLTGSDKGKSLTIESTKKSTILTHLGKEKTHSDEVSISTRKQSKFASEELNQETDTLKNDLKDSPNRSKSSMGSHLSVTHQIRKNSKLGSTNTIQEPKRVPSIKKSKEKVDDNQTESKENVTNTKDKVPETVNTSENDRKKFDRSYSMKTVQINVPPVVENTVDSADLTTNESIKGIERKRNLSKSHTSFLENPEIIMIQGSSNEKQFVNDETDSTQENILKPPKLNRMLSQNLQSLLHTSTNKLESKQMSNANILHKSVADFRKLLKSSTKDIVKQVEHEMDLKNAEELCRSNDLNCCQGKALVTKKKIDKDIRKTWVLIFRTFELAQKILKSYKQKNYMKVTEVPVKDARTLSYLLRVQIVEPNPVYISQVVSLLKDEPFQRKKEDVTALEKMLSYRMEDFRKFPLNERIFFCQSMRIEKYKKDTLLMMEDHVATCFYFLLSGQVEIFKLEGECKYRLNLKNPGSAIGELRINLPGSKRTACAATTTDTMLLWISKEEYLEFVNRGENNAMRENMVQSLKYMQLFDKYEDVLEKISSFFKIYTFGKNTVIQEEGKQTLDLSWIIEGSCKINRAVSFMTRMVNGKQVLSPFVPDQAKKDNYTTLELCTQVLSIGDWFPSLPIISDNPQELKYLGPIALKKDDYVELYSKMRSEDKRLYSRYSVVADSTVIIASMPYTDFLQLVPREVIFEMVVKPCVTIYPIEELQDQYLQQEMWINHKKTVVNEIVK